MCLFLSLSLSLPHSLKMFVRSQRCLCIKALSPMPEESPADRWWCNSSKSAAINHRCRCRRWRHRPLPRCTCVRLAVGDIKRFQHWRATCAKSAISPSNLYVTCVVGAFTIISSCKIITITHTGSDLKNKEHSFSFYLCTTHTIYIIFVTIKTKQNITKEYNTKRLYKKW